MKIYEELKSILKEKNGLLDENGEIKKWVIMEKARNYDNDLIKLLLKNERLKSEFFKKIDETTIFLQEKFCDFLELKSFMSDSFTSFKNKIGLTNGNKFISKDSHVVLNFPYKDCVLEGGASHDDDKGKEIFFNEILARDEITQLFNPKVLTNFKRVQSINQSINQSIKFNRDENINLSRGLPKDTITDNLLIKGNNLLALHSLKKEFAGRVKLIYIDPPYNTGNDSFKYNDSFNHSSWLVFMKNRLEIARELLREDGSIYVNLDYNEVHYCKVLMDEIFGLENFQREVIWRIGWLSGYKTGVSNYVRNHDSILFYSKNKNKMFFNKIYIDNSNFKELISKNKLADILCDYDMDKKQISNIYNKINFDTRIKRYPIEDVWNANEYDDLNSIAIISYSGESVSKMLGTDEVKGQKSEKLIQRIIQSSTNENDIILDFFAGSGTTAAVAMKMNRQFIAIEQMDYIETITKERLKKVIEGEQGGVSRALGWQGGGEFVYFELKKHNELFKEKILKAKNKREMLEIFKGIDKNAFLNYKVDMREFYEDINKFEALSLEEQKWRLNEFLDKNQLYVNLSSINDADFEISDDEKKASVSFYGEIK